MRVVAIVLVLSMWWQEGVANRETDQCMCGILMYFYSLGMSAWGISAREFVISC